MRTFRLLAIAMTVALAFTFVTPTASAAEGVGSASGDLTLLEARVGGDTPLVAVDLGADSGASNSDTDAGDVEASTAFAPFAVTSETLDALNVTGNGAQAHSSGEKDVDSAGFTIDDDALDGVVSGTILPVHLEALIGDDGPQSSIVGEVTDLTLVGGLLGLPDIANVGLSTNAAPSHAISTRNAVVPNLDMLDLADLLESLDLPLSALSASTVGDLLEAVEGSIPVGGDAFDATAPLSDAASLTGAITEVTDADDGAVPALEATAEDVADIQSIDDLETLLATLDTLVLDQTIDDACDLLDVDTSTIESVDSDLAAAITALASSIDTANDELADLGSESIACTTLSELADQIDALDTTLQDTLGGVLGDVIDTLAGVTLLSASDARVSVTNKATDSVDTSIAEISASVGSFSVGPDDLPGVALDDVATAAISDVESDLNGSVGGILGAVDASLSELVDVDLLGERSSDISESGGRVTSTSELTLLKVSVDPPADLDDLVDGLGSVTGLGAQIQSLGGTVPEVGTEMQTFEETTATDASAAALASAGATELTVLSLVNSATFAPTPPQGTPDSPDDPSPAPTGSPESPEGQREPSPELPKTGLGQTGLMLGAAALLGASWVGRRSWLRTDR